LSPDHTLEEIPQRLGHPFPGRGGASPETPQRPERRQRENIPLGAPSPPSRENLSGDAGRPADLRRGEFLWIIEREKNPDLIAPIRRLGGHQLLSQQRGGQKKISLPEQEAERVLLIIGGQA